MSVLVNLHYYNIYPHSLFVMTVADINCVIALNLNSVGVIINSEIFMHDTRFGKPVLQFHCSFSLPRSAAAFLN